MSVTTAGDQQDYWERCRAGEFSLQRCGRCGHVRFPMADICPACLSPDWEWRQVSGRGTVWSWIRMHQRYFPEGSFELPYVVLFVDLVEGPTMISAPAADVPADLQIGDEVEVVLEPTLRGDRIVPRFRPVRDRARVEAEAAR